MAEIRLTKRIKYAGDVHARLVDCGWDIDTATAFLNDIPDASPTKHGRWVEKTQYIGSTYYDCSVCGESFTTIEGTPSENYMFYCPSCGAKMDLEDTTNV